MTQETNVNESSDEIAFVGPGQLLANARQTLGMSQQDVAERLNFRASLVSDIEKDVFDTSLPDTFNRGYLKNYAKLVEIKEQEILASYEALNIVNKHNAKMQSFSKETEKQAQNSLLMWISYLILAALIGSSIVWWVQDAQNNNVTESVAAQDDKTSLNAEEPDSKTGTEIVKRDEALSKPSMANTEALDVTNAAPVKQTEENDIALQSAVSTTDNEQQLTAPPPSEQDAAVESQIEQNQTTSTTDVTQVQFTFSGDCWVNIYDATGERVAWGIKKGGYVMEISGVAPFKVTLGKPELVSINFAGEAIDMSQFNRGNIAKFTLPLNEAN